jgi:hypothetical protein
MATQTIGAPPAPPDVAGDSGRDDCPWAPKHLPVIVYTRRLRDRFRLRYHVRCWACELDLGPREVWAMANAQRQDLEGLL